MSAESISFTTRSVAGKGGGDAAPSAWTAQVIAKRTVDEDEFFADVAARTRQSVADVSYIFSTAGQALRDFLRQGCRVSLSDVGFSLTLTGKFPTADAAPDAANNGLMWSTYVHQEMPPGLYNICFVSGGKICYLVQISLIPEQSQE